MVARRVYTRSDLQQRQDEAAGSLFAEEIGWILSTAAERNLGYFVIVPGDPDHEKLLKVAHASDPSVHWFWYTLAGDELFVFGDPKAAVEFAEVTGAAFESAPR